jgi:polyphosphate kinase
MHRYFQRDESWMRFNERVLQEAEDTHNPLLERVKFLAITASNLDEFIEIRIAGVLQRMEEEANLPQHPDESGRTREDRLRWMAERLHAFGLAQDVCWNKQLLPQLEANGIRLLRWKQLTKTQRVHVLQFYREQIDPLLTPVTIDPAHPFPRVLNKALCIALELRPTSKGRRRDAPSALGVLTVPRSLPRLIELPSTRGHNDFLLLDELIQAHAAVMYRGYKVLSTAPFRVTRNSNLYMQEEESRSILESVRSELHNRRKGDAVRLQIDASAAPSIVEALSENFELEPWQVFRTTSPVNLSRLMHLHDEVPRADLKFPPFTGRTYKPLAPAHDIFADMRARDILLHHPFDSYKAVEDLIVKASEDERVVSMRQTLYRTSADSPMFRGLTDAASRKDVTVVVELMARFDEASNIRWARELEEAGVQVYHGIFGLKTHCKLAMLVRRDPDGVTRRYCHLGTGNYNAVTARFYTDISLLTTSPALCDAVENVFRYLTADWQGVTDAYRPLLVAPITLADDLHRLIHRETLHARAGKPAHIIAKMNALLDQKVIDALYEASHAGVSVDLIVRGMCALRPGVEGLSENIRVRSIVGRFLEHSRIFWFANAGASEVFAGSADWMQRNLYERCEVVFPVTDTAASTRLRAEILEAYLLDDRKARLLQPDGEYLRPKVRGHGFSSQRWLMEQALSDTPTTPHVTLPTAASAAAPRHRPARPDAAH